MCVCERERERESNKSKEKEKTKQISLTIESGFALLPALLTPSFHAASSILTLLTTDSYALTQDTQWKVRIKTPDRAYEYKWTRQEAIKLQGRRVQEQLPSKLARDGDCCNEQDGIKRTAMAKRRRKREKLHHAIQPLMRVNSILATVCYVASPHPS